MLPSEWLETNVASTDFKKESTESFDEEARRGYEVEECKYFDEEKEFGDRELQSQNTKKNEEKQRRETLMLVDIESKVPRRLQEENRGKFLKRNGGSKDEEVEFRLEQNEFAVCTQEKNSDCLDLLSPEVLSLVGGSEVNMREIIQSKNFCRKPSWRLS